MSQCRQEGDWRAYCDGELPAADMALAREHLAGCAECRELHREVSERAARVSTMMMDLEAAPAIVRPAAVSRPAWKWAAAGIALAAALAAAFVLAPGRVPAVQAPEVHEIASAPAEAPAPPVTLATPPVVTRVSHSRPARRPSQRPQYFLGLDNEPIDTGVMMRVAFENGMEADLIVDSAGRARAIRAVR